VTDDASLVRLWAHEALRVFHDRLVDDGDRGWFCNLLSQMLPKHLGMQFNTVFQVDGGKADVGGSSAGSTDAAVTWTCSADNQPAEAVAGLRDVLFADFLTVGAPTEEAKYREAKGVGELLKAVEDALVDYNAQVGCNC